MNRKRRRVGLRSLVVAYRSIGVALSISFYLFSCATTPETKQDIPDQIIDMGDYSVRIPPSTFGAKLLGRQDWTVNIEKEKRFVEFLDVRRVYGEFSESTLIRVFQNTVNPEKWHLTEEEVANDYRKLEETIMNEEGVNKKQYELEDIKRDTMELSGKKLYTMSHTKLIGSVWSGFTEKVAIYLYFPRDFNERHNFYIFLLSRLYVRSRLSKPFPTQTVYDVIDSFRQK